MTIVRAVHRAQLYALRARPGIGWTDSFVCVTWKQVEVDKIVTARWRFVLYIISCLKCNVLVPYRLRATCTSCFFRTDFVRIVRCFICCNNALYQCITDHPNYVINIKEITTLYSLLGIIYDLS